MDKVDLEIRGNVVNILARGECLEARINGPKSAAFIIWGALTDTLISYEMDRGNGEGQCVKALASLIFMEPETRKALLCKMKQDYEKLDPSQLIPDIAREV